MSVLYTLVMILIYIILAIYIGEVDEGTLLLLEAANLLLLLSIELLLPSILKKRKSKDGEFELFRSETYIKSNANYISNKVLFCLIPLFSILQLVFWIKLSYRHIESIPHILVLYIVFHLIWRVIRYCLMLPYHLHLKKDVKEVKTTINIYKDLINGKLPDLNKILILFINHGKSRSTQDVNHLYFKNIKNTVLLNEDEILRILRNREEHKRLLFEQISCFCYLLEPRNKEEFYHELEQIYENVFVKLAGGFNKQVIIFNYSNQEENYNIPLKFKNMSAIKICPIHSVEEITEAQIRLLMEKEQGETKKRIEDSSNHFGRLADQNKDQSTFKQYFENSQYYLDQINCYGEYTNQFQFQNNELRNFFNSAVTFQNPIQSIMALIDYIEIILRLSAYYYGKQKFDRRLNEILKEEGLQGKKRVYRELAASNSYKNKRKEIIPSDLFSLGYELWRQVGEEDALYYNIHHRNFRYTKVLQPIFNAVGDFIYANFEGYQINFLGLVRTVNHIRNKVIAHGSLQNTILYPVWCLLFYSAVAITEFLGIEDMKLEYHEGSYWVSYIGNPKVSMENLIVNRNDYPCLAWNMNLKETAHGFKYTLKYINFFEGEMIKPEHFEENFDL